MGTGLVAFQSPRRKEAPSGTGACLFLTEAEDRRVSLALVFITSFPGAVLRGLGGTHSFG